MMRIILLRNNIKNDSDNYDCNDRRNQNVSVLCIEIHQLMESSPQKKKKKQQLKHQFCGWLLYSLTVSTCIKYSLDAMNLP